MSTETAALADAFRLINAGLFLGGLAGMFVGWLARDFFCWVGQLAARKAFGIDPRDVL